MNECREEETENHKHQDITFIMKSTLMERLLESLDNIEITGSCILSEHGCHGLFCFRLETREDGMIARLLACRCLDGAT